MWPSFASVGRIATAVAVLYAAHSVYTIVTLFSAPQCYPPKRCIRPSLRSDKPHSLVLFLYVPGTTPTRLLQIDDFDFGTPFSRDVELEIGHGMKNNASFDMYVGIVSTASKRKLNWREVREDGIVERMPLVEYAPRKMATFNLLGNEKSSKKKSTKDQTVAHLKSSASFCALSEPFLLPADEIPLELSDRIRLTRDREYLPILKYNPLKSRLSQLVEIDRDMTKANVTVEYSPASVGKLKFLVHIVTAMDSLTKMGFSERDIDDVKGLFADTNLYLLCATVLISSFHLLFDFLAFKNDVSFWRSKTSMEGLSMRTVLWRAFSQMVIFLYLFDENTSLLVLVPSGVASLIEFWKVKKILHLDITWGNGFLPSISTTSSKISNAEMKTRAVDQEAMKYLSYVLYPVCICGAIYSLLYQPHKSWYSWTLNSMVNGVYAFGFLFMLPQLFINYKLKSVAALPWRAFMYKAFNTFIDDVFAFIITMPVAHRVACFRDDIVFIIYLYQRWLYPVDKNRIDNSYAIEETVDESQKKKD